jgi:hypothetical protein
MSLAALCSIRGSIIMAATNDKLRDLVQRRFKLLHVAGRVAHGARRHPGTLPAATAAL